MATQVGLEIKRMIPQTKEREGRVNWEANGERGESGLESEGRM